MNAKQNYKATIIIDESDLNLVAIAVAENCNEYVKNHRNLLDWVMYVDGSLHHGGDGFVESKEIRTIDDVRNFEQNMKTN
ncbi:MAG: hypothetical protein GY734_21895 [Herbaspirillum sp.]|uniref:hypothetical protein n=1 Tax=Herbaspirillum sp. TaxID=1890675 RepID=UPI0025857F3F|nr:hypothetical protein [Herbaspirillum sp.]MCL4419409.1 hypothetical protein [Patescibacteria group bacterium]MCP3658520.1 hypothetical protein [Herbaspirillum sp.]MCP4033873.1 hypothetical protein [Herbaspirillum sp.]